MFVTNNKIINHITSPFQNTFFVYGYVQKYSIFCILLQGGKILTFWRNISKAWGVKQNRVRTYHEAHKRTKKIASVYDGLTEARLNEWEEKHVYWTYKSTSSERERTKKNDSHLTTLCAVSDNKWKEIVSKRPQEGIDYLVSSNQFPIGLGGVMLQMISNGPKNQIDQRYIRGIRAPENNTLKLPKEIIVKHYFVIKHKL